MYKLLIILCLICPLELLGQSGRYTIDREDNKKAGGYITITPYSITVQQDSTEIPLPVTQIVKDKDKVFYFLAGCYNNVSFKGAATLYKSDYEKDGKYNCVLYIEIRTSQSYCMTRYSLYFFENE